MTEIFANVRQEVKDLAEMSWEIALRQKTVADAAKFLNDVTNYYENLYTEEEVEFLQFYFHMKMEMMKNE